MIENLYGSGHDGSNLKPIEANKKTIAAIVEARIRDAILAGELVPGSRIDQVKLAETLDVSLVPVRESLKKLEAEGFVQIIPRRGAFVTNTSTRDMEELYLAREIIEGEAAFHAADKLTPADLDQLDSLMAQMSEALKKHDFGNFMTYNRTFHLTIYQAGTNRYLVNVILSLWDLAERYRYRYMYLHDQGARVQAEHQLIIDACRAHDKETLRQICILHMQHTLEGIKRFIEATHSK
jgi:DNA-binding GntR family transcriptional regulator